MLSAITGVHPQLTASCSRACLIDRGVTAGTGDHKGHIDPHIDTQVVGDREIPFFDGRQIEQGRENGFASCGGLDSRDRQWIWPVPARPETEA